MIMAIAPTPITWLMIAEVSFMFRASTIIHANRMTRMPKNIPMAAVPRISLKI